jgi:hypothetical protein
LGDGWIPFGLTHDELASMLGDGAVADAVAGRGDAFAVVLAPEHALDPVGEPDAAAAAVRSYTALGATALSLRFRHRSLAHYLEQLAAMAGVAADVAGAG